MIKTSFPISDGGSIFGDPADLARFKLCGDNGPKLAVSGNRWTFMRGRIVIL